MALRLRSMLLILFAALTVFSFVFAVPRQAAAGDFGLSDTVGVIEKEHPGAFAKEPTVLIGKIISAALSTVGILFFLLMLYSGFLWMTARGNEKTVAKAKEIMISAVIGVVIVATAYAITGILFSNVAGGDTLPAGSAGSGTNNPGGPPGGQGTPP